MGEVETRDVEVSAWPLGYVDTISLDGRILRMPLPDGLPAWDGPPVPILSRGPERTAVGKLTEISILRGQRQIMARGFLFGQVPQAQPFIEAGRLVGGCPVMLDLDVDPSNMSTYIPADRHEAGELAVIMVYHRWRIRAVTVDVDGGMPVWEGCALRNVTDPETERI